MMTPRVCFPTKIWRFFGRLKICVGGCISRQFLSHFSHDPILKKWNTQSHPDGSFLVPMPVRHFCLQTSRIYNSSFGACPEVTYVMRAKSRRIAMAMEGTFMWPWSPIKADSSEAILRQFVRVTFRADSSNIKSFCNKTVLKLEEIGPQPSRSPRRW